MTEPSHPALKRLHVVGCPRSGTTLLMQMISNCFAHDGSCDHEQTVYLQVPADSGLYLTKQPTDILHIGYILDRDPELYVIAILRDPRAVISSIHDAQQNQYFCNYPIWERCWYAIEALNMHPQFMSLRYEDLIADPDAIQHQIKQRFPFLAETSPFSNYHQSAKPDANTVNALGGLRQVDPQSLSKWKKHLPRIKEQVQRYPEMQMALEALDYEATDEWQNILQDVEPVDYPCRYPTHPNWLKEMEKKLRIRFKAKRYLNQRGL